MGNFVGKGYSEEFTVNMSRVIAALHGGEKLVLTDGADDICTACPFNNDGVCKDIEKVNRYDASAKNVLELEYGKEYNYSKSRTAVNDNIYKTGKLSDICGNCEWFELCTDVILSKK